MDKRSFLKAVAAAAGYSLPYPASASDYPNRPVVFVAPFAAGSTTDGAARVLVAHMARTLGQPGVIDNKVGAGGTIGLTAASRAKPDGYTLVFTGMSAHVIASFTIADLPWDPVTSFTPIGQVAVIPLGMAINSAVPAANLKEFIAYAKTKPGELTFGTLGTSTAQSLAMAMFMQRTGIAMREVPYKTSAQILTDVSAGRVDFIIDNVVNVIPGVQGGRLRPLAVTTSRRVDVWPDVPTVAEAAVPGFNVASWVGLAAPAGLPADIVATVSGALVKALDSAEYKQWLQANGAMPPEYTEPRAFAAYIGREVKLWKTAADAAGVSIAK